MRNVRDINSEKIFRWFKIFGIIVNVLWFVAIISIFILARMKILVDFSIFKYFSFFVFGIFILPIIILVIMSLTRLICKGKLLTKILIISILLDIMLMLSGVWISYSSIKPFGDYYIDKVKVVDVQKEKIIIDYTKYNNGDYKLKEIDKPFYANVKKNDIVTVKYKKDSKEDMYYILSYETGMNILMIGQGIFAILVGIGIYLLFRYIKSK